MKLRTFVSLLLALCLILPGTVIMAQEEAEESTVPAAVEEAEQQEPPVPVEEALTYEDYSVKGYTITVFGGNFSGAKYLENMDLHPRTKLTEGAGDIMGYDGEILRVSQDTEHYTGAHKEIESGPAFGARIGIYISDNFHLDLLGTYATGEAVTTMKYTDNPEIPSVSERLVVDSDPGYKMYKGGVALMYDAQPATFYGIVPRLGFGMGGIINRYTELPDVTGLYLEGNFALNATIFKDWQLGGQVDLTTFAYDVEELGYSNMVNFVTFSLGVTVFLDTVPPEVRASHEAGQNH